MIKVTSEVMHDPALKEIGGKGLFTREIEEALDAGGIHKAWFLTHAQGMTRAFSSGVRRRERSWPFRGPRIGSSVRCGSGFRRFGGRRLGRLCARRRFKARILCPAMGFLQTIKGFASIRLRTFYRVQRFRKVLP